MGVWRFLIVLVLFVAGMGTGYYTGLTESQRSIDGLRGQLGELSGQMAETERRDSEIRRTNQQLAAGIEELQKSNGLSEKFAATAREAIGRAAAGGIGGPEALRRIAQGLREFEAGKAGK